MHKDLLTRRRVLLVTYRRYLDADRAWTVALREVKTWFPAASRPGVSTIGNPGSPMRRLFEQRERALLQFETARLKLEAARRRFAARECARRSVRVMLITCVDRELGATSGAKAR
ncbi:MAG: hypothetical protein RQ750_00840 [Roseovarius sp.]|nr:hypothetical protein [Roseovarius sp.]